MKSFNNEQKNDLLKDYFVNKKTFLTVIIISSSLILLTAILIVILLNTSTNRLYDNEKILPGYIQINSISATYNIDDISKAVLLYNNKYRMEKKLMKLKMNIYFLTKVNILLNLVSKSP